MTSTRRLWLLAVLAVVPLLGATAPAPLSFKSGPARAALVELFTSEGCSSCPPAEVFFSSLRGAPGLWTRFVPVAFHVDYWDRLGWPDPLSFSGATARQRGYARAWGARGIYTPDIVRNGQDASDWRAAVSGRSDADAAPAGILEARPTPDGAVAVSFTPAEAGGDWVAQGALLGFDIVSQVKAGENEGRTLRHDFAVLSYGVAPLQGSGAVKTAVLRLASASKTTGQRQGLAVWVVRRGDSEPAQAVGGYLPGK